MPDAETLAACDAASLYNSHNDWLKSWLRRQLGCRETAADLAQDTFARVLAQLRLGALPLDSLRAPRAYLATVAQRLMFNRFRRQSLEQAWIEDLQHLPQRTEPSPEQRTLTMEALQFAWRALEALPAAAQQAFELSQLEGWTCNRIAQELGVSERTVRRYVERGLVACTAQAA